MTDVTANGWLKQLDCPVCGEPCRTIPPLPPDPEHPYPHWTENDEGICQCGAAVVVKVDDYAYLDEKQEKASNVEAAYCECV